jgi:hypothetical protein
VNVEQDAGGHLFRGLPQRPGCKRNCSRRLCKKVANDRWKPRECPRLTRRTIDVFKPSYGGGGGGGSVVVTSRTTVVVTTTVSDWVTTFVTTSVTG